MAGSVVELVFGLILLATWLMIPLWTIEMMQVYHYFNGTGRTDRWYLKAVVAFVAVADTGATCLICEWAYSYGVTHWGDSAYLATQGLELPAHNILVSFTACACQTYLALRFFKLSKNVWVFGALIALTVAAQASAIYISVIEVTHRTVADRNLVIVGAEVWLSCEAATDVGISMALVYYLLKFRLQTTFDDTRSMLLRLILVTVESGTLTSLFAIATLVAAVTALQTNICLFFVFLLGRVYGCTLMYNLNIGSARNENGTSDFGKTGASNQPVNTYHLSALSRAEDLHGVTVERQTHVYVERDGTDKSVEDSKTGLRY